MVWSLKVWFSGQKGEKQKILAYTIIINLGEIIFKTSVYLQCT